jgi:hypothetical protein
VSELGVFCELLARCFEQLFNDDTRAGTGLFDSLKM